MHQLSTHILDTARGQPAAGVAVSVERLGPDGAWTAVGQGVTNADGRIPSLLSSDADVTDGDYRFIFATADYFRVAGAADVLSRGDRPRPPQRRRQVSHPAPAQPLRLLDLSRKLNLPLRRPLPETGGEKNDLLPLPASGRGSGG